MGVDKFKDALVPLLSMIDIRGEGSFSPHSAVYNFIPNLGQEGNSKRSQYFGFLFSFLFFTSLYCVSKQKTFLGEYLKFVPAIIFEIIAAIYMWFGKLYTVIKAVNFANNWPCQ